MLSVWDGEDFAGAKLALILEDQILTYRRDDKPDIPFPNCWDLPGGGREGDEAPTDCALRELAEEFGLNLPYSRLTLGRRYERADRLPAYFFIGDLSADDVDAIEFGDEGQYWRLMPIGDFLAETQAVSALQERLRDCLSLEYNFLK